MRKKDIVVVGSGLVGALLARVLAERGHRVRVLERRADLRKTEMSAGRSINLALSDRGFRALDAVGVGDAVRRIAIPMKGRRIHAPDGTLTFQPYGKEDQAIYSVSRGGLNAVLMDHAEAHGDVEILFEQRCVAVDVDGPAVLVEDARTQKERRIEADLVFGADGAFSAVRLSLMMRPRFDYAQSYLAHGYKELSIPPADRDDSDSFRIDKNALHIWPRGGFMLIALPNLDGSFTCTLFLPYEGERSFAALKSPDDVRALFRAEFSDALELMPTLTDDFFANPTGDLAIIRCAPWHANDRVCLIGDAAHAIVPFYGQGMNAGFEDCRVLKDLLEAMEDPNDWGEVFRRFFALRKENTDAIADLALMNFVEMRDKVASPHFLLQKQIEAKIHELFGDAYLPLYSMVTFSHIPYAEALRLGREHEELMQRIMRIDGIESRWHTPEGEALLRAEVEQALSRRRAYSGSASG